MLFRALERDFQAARRSGKLKDAFDGWRVYEPVLSHYSDPDALIDHLLKSDQDRITAQEEQARAELATPEADLDKWREVLTVAIRVAGGATPMRARKFAVDSTSPC
ncbi:hypothetical protein BH20ACT23_BH20ACT23_30930 [soil metagenome]